MLHRMNAEEKLKEKVRPVYRSLMGLLSQIRLEKDLSTISDPDIWEGYHNDLTELETIGNSFL